ncbi:MAG: LacI family DNA-binding transcriptional regulator [Terracidiphilus sp.]
MNRAPRMSDVAKLAGVGTMTVSRVLSGSVRVSEDTARRVFDAIATLNYRPNEVARALRDQRSHQIGIIVPNLIDPFFAICAQTVSVVAKEHLYSVIIATADEDVDMEYSEASRMLRRQVEGFVIIPAAGGVCRIAGSEFNRTPIVTLDRPIENSSYDSVVVENRFGSQLGVNHLIQHGHNRIAFFGLSRNLYTIKARFEGYRDAMKKANLKPDVYFGNGTQTEMLSTIRGILDRKNPPTAIFTSNNLISRHAVHALAHLKVRIPDAVALVGFDDFETANILNPALTVVRQPITDMARMGANILFSRLLNNDMSDRGKHIVLPVELVIRESCGLRHKPSAPRKQEITESLLIPS